MSGELRIGFYGFGFIGRVHAFGYQALPFFYPSLPKARFVAVCESTKLLGDEAKAGFGFERATTNLRELTEADDIDVVHIATPNLLHRDALLSAMAAGKHIYCEKPLVTSLAQAREVEAALKAYRGVGQMGLQTRFFPATLRAKELSDAGFFGQLLSFRAAYLHAGSADPRAPLKWKLSKDVAGGGVLLDLGSHIIDLVRHIGGEFAEVRCETKIAFAERPSPNGKGSVKVEAEDLALITARTVSGALGTIEATKLATGALDEVRFEFHGTRGAMRFNSMRPNWLEVYSMDDAEGPTGGERGWTAIDTAGYYPPPATRFPGPKFSIGWLRAGCACVANLVEAISTGKPAEPSLAVGIRIQEIMDACYRSAQDRKPVAV